MALQGKVARIYHVFWQEVGTPMGGRWGKLGNVVVICADHGVWGAARDPF